MADFGQLSDTDESAVEELITQAKDLSVLEQIAKINTSGFSDSSLPTDLESRFRKLKSFPVSNSHKPQLLRTNSNCESFDFEEILDETKQTPDGKSRLEKETRTGCVLSPLNSSIGEEKKGSEKKLEDGYGSSPSGSSNSWLENMISSPSKQKKTRSFGGSSSNSSSSQSPPVQRSGCFWCSPKKDSKNKKNSKEKWSFDDKWKRKEEDELLEELGVISVKEQEKIMKKAMKEQEKFNREAEKIVKWAKQASARMSFHGIEYESSDDGKYK